MKKKYIAGMFALMTLMIQAQPLPPPAVGNRPHSITDDADPQTVYGAMEFNDGSNSGQEYFYDACGSLVADANKGIAHIEYDNCNYPKKVQFTNGNTIEYVYTPDGQKLRAKYQTAIDNIVVPLNTTTTLSNSQIVNTTQTDYVGNVIYTGMSSGASTTTSLNKFLFAGGYATFSNNVPTYHYYTQDHLGNNRAVVNDNGTIEQITHYYPFGGTYADVGLNSSLQPYKYNGKELDRMHGLNLYDYGARHYDAIVPMFTQIDPLAEKYYNFSPYVYCANNPAKYVDDNGQAPGDFFKNLDDAAIDFGNFYNDDSIRDDLEYGSTIFRITNSKGESGFTYTIANVGKKDRVTVSSSPNVFNDVATIHTHAAYSDNYYNNEFSGIRDKNHQLLSKDEKAIQYGYNDIGNANRRQLDSYVVTPNGSLQKYDPKANTITVISNEMPSDPKDPSRLNTIGVEENNPYSHMEFLKMLHNTNFKY